MSIFRDPTLALSTAVVVGLAGLTGVALAVGEAPVVAEAAEPTDEAVRQYRQLAGGALRLGATADPSLHRIGAQLSEMAAEQSQATDGDMAAAWADATAAGRRLATVDLADPDAVYAAVVTTLSSGDVLAQVLGGAAYRQVSPAASLEEGDPQLRRAVPGVERDLDPTVPARPRVPGGELGRPRLGDDAPSAPMPSGAVPSAPAATRS